MAVAVLTGLVVVLKFGVSLPPEVTPEPLQGEKVSPVPLKEGMVSELSNTSDIGPGGASVSVEQRVERVEAGPQQSEWEVIEKLLARPKPVARHSILMRDVPRLSAEAEKKLIDLYYWSSDSLDKLNIVRILAFGGGASSCAVLINGLTTEYSGKEVDDVWEAALVYFPALIGVMAGRVPEAYEFLKKGANPEFWFGVRLWHDKRGYSPDACAMAGACIKGLALTGGIETLQMIEHYRSHPQAATFAGPDGVVLCDFASSVVDAAFIFDIVSERGLEGAMDQLFYDPELTMRTFSKWYKSPEGLEWQKWRSAVREAAKAERSATGSTSPE